MFFHLHNQRYNNPILLLLNEKNHQNNHTRKKLTSYPLLPWPVLCRTGMFHLSNKYQYKRFHDRHLLERLQTSDKLSELLYLTYTQ